MKDQICKEPSSRDNDGFKFQLLESDSQVFIKTYNKQKLIDGFKVLAIERLKIAISNREFGKVTFVDLK
ncbi:MAG TPA: hypothetical protein VF008_29375 [Niastella sp.]